MKFLLFVGENNSLALPEVTNKIPTATQLLPSIFGFDLPSKEQAIAIVSRLGSSVKLAEAVTVDSLDPEILSRLITTKNFSLTNLNQDDSANKAGQVKALLTKPSRYLMPKSKAGLSPVLLSRQDVTELFLKDQSVYQTVWWHDFKSWIKKDRLVPFANARAGLLPPKIARSLVNLVPIDPPATILDPFCGSGRVLIEASELGFKAIGMDISDEQIRQTKKNLSFLKLEADLIAGDATHASLLLNFPPDAIVTEPFLGRPGFRPEDVKNIVTGLKKLYLGCLKDWVKFLKPQAPIVMIFPQFVIDSQTYKTSDIVDGKLLLSYNLKTRGLIYSRPTATVRREILVLERK
ncbi:methyltransferase domain-containing protein [Candidatus Collierbacteria bacterium]|nr:methyltransferase domain-containing protein [Candidatus Collierbacteria bacterium]